VGYNISSDDVTAMTYTVFYLEILEYSIEEDTFSGKADPGSEEEKTGMTDFWWGYLSLEVSEDDFDIQAGDTITVTQDDISESHTVTDLSLTEVDEVANT